MAFSRRPAKFKRPESMQNKEISQEQLESLRAAAARVYVNKQNPAPAHKFSEVNTVVVAAGCASVKEEAAGFENGVQLLAEAAAKFEEEEEKANNLGKGKKAP